MEDSKKHNKESNQMKKSLLALSLAAILMTGLTGCDNADKISKATTTTATIDQVSADTRHTMEIDTVS